MTGEVLRLGHNGVVGVEAITLRATHVREAELTGKKWVLAEVFFDAPPAGLARYIKNRREDHVHARSARFCRNSGAGLLRDLGIPGSSKIDRCRKNRAGVETVQALLDKERRNAKAIVCDHPTLDGVCLLRCGIQIMDGAHTQIAPNTLRLLRKEDGIECRVRVICMFIDDFAGAGIHIQLARLLLWSHTTQ